ncbi:MAG: alcohol dehydrogenase catalytic domain-containing protein, partial [bacterium]
MQAGAYLDEGKVGVLEVDEPPSPGRGEVTLDSAFAGVCGSDLHMVEAQFFPPGQVLGHEFSATVRALGEGVEAFTVGDRVTLRPWVGCGHCAPCGDGHDPYCEEATGIGTFHGLTPRGLPGGMAPRLNVPAAALHHLPGSIGLELGALIEPLAVAWHAIQATDLGSGDDCVILGAGPIGIALILAARASGV